MREQAIKELIDRRLNEKDIYSKSEAEHLFSFYQMTLMDLIKEGKDEVLAEEETKRSLTKMLADLKPKNRFIFPFVMSFVLFLSSIGEFILYEAIDKDPTVFAYYVMCELIVSVLFMIVCIIVNRQKHLGSYISGLILVGSLLLSFAQLLPVLVPSMRLGSVEGFVYFFPYGAKLEYLYNGKPYFSYLFFPELILTCLSSIFHLIMMTRREITQRSLSS